jgi:predicted oxidoreductase
MAEDLQFSRVALGFWRWDEWGISVQQLEGLVNDVLERGITTMDHANGYASGRAEEAFGKVLAAQPSLREKVEIIDKCTLVYPSDTVRVKYYDTSEQHVVEQVEQMLRKLNTDYIDLLLLHRPDPLMDPESTAAAFTRLHDAGKVRHFGVSNYKPLDYDMLASFVDQPLITNQFEVSVLQHENFDDRTVQHAVKQRIHPIAWSPLAGGRIFTGTDEVSIRVRAELERIRGEIGAERIDDVAFAWIYTHPVGFVPITGSCELEYIERPLSALQYTLTKEQWFAIWSAYTGRRVP